MDGSKTPKKWVKKAAEPDHPEREEVDPAAALPDWPTLDPAGCARPPDYRWSLARRRAAGAFVPPAWVDDWVALGARSLAAPLEKQHGPALAAVAAARSLGAADWLRVAVETRLLAGESFDVIATKEGLTPAVVAAYEALHYAVTDRLSASSYINHVAVGLNSPRETDPRTHVRALAYAGGPLVADAVLDVFNGPPPGPGAPPEVRRRYRQARLAVEYRCTPVRPRDLGKLARFFLLNLEHERRVGRRRGTSGATHEA